MRIKEQLKLYMELRDISAAELSRRSGVSKQVISTWLADVEPKNITHVRKVAEVLQTTVDHLCFGEGKDLEHEKVTELDALLGDDWIGGTFEIRLRRVRKR